MLVKHFKERGWAVTQRGTHAVCPECQRRSSVARPVLSDQDAEVAFARQREADEKRRLAETRPAATTEVASAFSAPPAPRTIADVIKDCLAIIDEIPTRPFRGAIAKSWSDSPKLVAKLAAEYIRADAHDRSRMVYALVQKAPALQSGLLKFSRGQNSNGTVPWPELQAEMRALGVEPLGDGDAGIRRFKVTGDKAATANPTDSEAQEAKEVTATAAKDEPSREARRAQAKMYSLLEAHFVVPDGSNVGSYDGEWSDEKVAAESGMSAAEVARTRDQVYGHMIDPRLVEVEADLARARADVANEVAVLREMVEAVKRKADEKIAALASRVLAIKAR